MKLNQYKISPLVYLILACLSISFTANSQKNGKFTKVKEDDMVSEVHRNNLGKIFFANEEIKYENPDENLFKKRINANERLYVRAYFPNAAVNEPQVEFNGKKLKYYDPCAWNCSFQLDLYVNGDFATSLYKSTFEGDENQWTTRQFNVVPDPEEASSNSDWKEVVDGLELGEYEAELRFYFGRPDKLREAGYSEEIKPIASGKFTLVKDSNAGVKIGTTFNDNFRAGMSNEVLESEILQKIQERAQKFEHSLKHLDLKISSQNWEVNRNEYTSVIIDRSLMVVTYSELDKGTCEASFFTITQDHNGSSFDEYFTITTLESEVIDCRLE